MALQTAKKQELPSNYSSKFKTQNENMKCYKLPNLIGYDCTTPLYIFELGPSPYPLTANKKNDFFFATNGGSS